MTGSEAFVIVVGFDGSENAQHALTWAVEEAKQRNGQVRLVTAWSKPPLAWYPALLETAVGEKIVVEDSPQQMAEAVQAAALKILDDEGVAATGQVVHSDSAASAVLDAASAADLIVVGSRGHGGFPGLHLGSVSAQVSGHAPCSVLVVRPKAS